VTSRRTIRLALPVECGDDTDLLRAAAEVVQTLPLYVSIRRGHSDLYAAFGDFARTFAGPDIEKAAAALAQWDDQVGTSRPSDMELPSDAACDRWTPELHAAYYIGLAMGLRLARVSELVVAKGGR
jgi:hypothetical protein